MNNLFRFILILSFLFQTDDKDLNPINFVHEIPMAHTPCNFNHSHDVKTKSHRRNDKSLTKTRSCVPGNMFATDVRSDNATVNYIITCVLSCFLTINCLAYCR